jgi:3-oxoacyl-[acyl-carrier-protein] synthase III
MIGIKAIASYIPPHAVDNVVRAEAFGETEDFLRNKIGALRLPLKEADQDTSDLAMWAVQALFEQCSALDPNAVDAIVVVTQNPDGEGLPHTAAVLQSKLKLPNNVAAFDVSLGCSGYVYGLFVLKGFLEASGLSNGILVTADPYSKVVDPQDRATSLLFGDAATATWLGPDPQWRLDAVAYGTNGTGAEYLKTERGRLHMNGRQVFNFALTQVAPHIKQLLQRQELAGEDVDLYCLHQGSAAIVEAIARQFPGLADRFVKDMLETGNTVSSSIPLLLQKRIFGGEAQRIVLSGFGVGLSWASAIISKSDKD